jgi:hypothetical protein
LKKSNFFIVAVDALTMARNLRRVRQVFFTASTLSSSTIQNSSTLLQAVCEGQTGIATFSISGRATSFTGQTAIKPIEIL